VRRFKFLPSQAKMKNRDPRFDPSGRGKAPKQGGVGVPAKGDSSSSDSAPDPKIPDSSFDSQATFVDPDATMIEGMLAPLPSPTPNRRPASRVQAIAPMLEAGEVLGGRYEILQLLGEGGMGAVYKAQDRELDRPVALKLIRAELASNPSILARFKQELLLSRQVTHKNVIRIFDLGDAEGVKFITMEFVEGRDLRALIQEKKKFSPEEAVEIMHQVCQALEAAHGVGVIHRDLKPQNIMREDSGRILVMDFGLARTVEGDGMTQVGALVGTMEYMSPEQALATPLDQRSDIFTAGLILYELLTGKMPFRADSALASLIKRTQERALPISAHDSTLPVTLTSVVNKCLERDPALRYQTATEMLRDLDAWEGNRAGATLGFHADVKPWGQTIPWPIVMGLATVLLLGTVGYVFRGRLLSSPDKAASAPALSLAVMPFQNASGDSSWDWLGPSLSDMLSTDVGQSAHLRTISSDRVQQVFHDLRIAPNSTVDSSTLGRVAEFTNADTLVWGRYTKLGDQIRIDATVQDRKHDRTVQVKAEAANQQDLSAAVDRLAGMIRQNLSLSSDLVKELQGQSFKPTSTSVDALRDYNEGLQLLRQGNNLEAQKKLQAATTEDPQFAVAFSRLGEAYSSLGYDTEAEQAARRAVDLSQNLPLAQKLFIEASMARVTKNSAKAMAAYETLAKSFPDNLDVLFALGGLYEDAGDLDKARSYYGKMLADGKNLDALLALGRVEIKAGNPQVGLDPLDNARHLAIDLDNQEQQALILQATGIAYRMMNKPAEALRNYEDSMAINQRLGQKRGVAASLVEIAQVQASLGKPDAALVAYNDALKIRREIGAKKDAGDTLIDLGDFYLERGQPDQALQAFKESLQIQRDSGDETYQALCLNNIATAYAQKGENEDALTYLQQALQIREKLNVPGDIAETLHNLGEAYASLGQYDQAMTSYMRGLDLYRKAGDNQGAAVMSRSMGVVFEHQGRLGPAVGALQDAVKAFRDLGDRSSTMSDSLSELADALAKAGRGSESAKLLEEAQGLAQGLKNDALLAAIANSHGDVSFYQGDLKPAKSSYEQALRLASHSADKDVLLASKLNLARLAVADGRSRAAVGDLKSLEQQADARDRKYISVASSVLLAEAMIKNKDYSGAHQELQRVQGRGEKLGLRLETARVHYLLGTALRLSGSASEAPLQYREASRMLDEIGKEQGAEHLMERFDLKTIYAESAQFAK
jgi:tetratricopeptide (TPR) repeat protein